MGVGHLDHRQERKLVRVGSLGKVVFGRVGIKTSWGLRRSVRTGGRWLACELVNLLLHSYRLARWLGRRFCSSPASARLGSARAWC